MITLHEHPTERALTRYLAGTDTPAERSRIESHMSECSDCRDDVAFARTVEQQAAALQPDDADAGLLARIHATLGPTSRSTIAAPSKHRWLHRRTTWGLAAAAVLVIAGALMLVLRSAPAVAGGTTGELSFVPSVPHAGDSIAVVYRPGLLFATETRLRLRARYRAVTGVPSPWVRQSVVADMARGPDGVFHGTLRLPDSVVYGVFAVEDLAAHDVDANNGQFWELLTHSTEQRPSFEALAEQIDDLYSRNWERALTLARNLTSLYPDRAQAWMERVFYEDMLLSGPAADSLHGIARAQLPALDRRFAAGPMDPEELGAMIKFAQSLDDTARSRVWMRALRGASPRGVLGIDLVLDSTLKILRSDPRKGLASLDSFWVADGNVHPGFLIYGLTAAQGVGDSAAVLRWVDRALASGDGDPVQLATALWSVPTLRDEELRRLRALVIADARPDDGLRALDHTLANEAPLQDDRRRSALVALGGALITRGDTGAGVDTLRLAAQTGWDASLFRRLAETYMSVGDTANARDMLARVAADPATDVRFGDSVRTRLGADPHWATQVASARKDLRARLLARAVYKALPDVQLTASDGRTVSLRTLGGNRPTFVAFWARGCPYLNLPALEALTTRLQSLGYTVVTIVDEQRSPDLSRFIADHHLTFPIYWDVNHEAQLAFNQWGVPVYHVLDGSGHLRYARQPLSAIAAELESLAGQ